MSAPLVLADRDARWYDASGTPVYEVPRADGAGMRAPTRADARKLGLLPSVTTVLSVLHKPSLQAWKEEQLVIAALTLPRAEGENLEAFARRVIEDARAESAKAREFGIALHRAISTWLQDPESPFVPYTLDGLDPYLDGFQRWYETSGLVPVATEQAFANEAVGYGGTIDFGGTLTLPGDDPVQRGAAVVPRHVIADWKTQRTKVGQAVRFYPEWGPQLAAYARGLWPDIEPSLLSVVISSTEPGRVEAMLWPGDGRREWSLFKACLELWQSEVAS